MNKQLIEVAARTARMLGYRLITSNGIALDGTPVLPCTSWVTVPNAPILSPTENVLPTTYCARWLTGYWGSDTMWYVPTETEMLGHWLVRLHMEKHYGISTPHYWEKDYGK